jgi:hypothetical protein
LIQWLQAVWGVDIVGKIVEAFEIPRNLGMYFGAKGWVIE